MNIEIRDLTPADAPECDATIASLPYFFGDPTGVEECARAVREQRGLAAIVDARFAGFLTVLQHNPESAEITWMAVHADHRRAGLGQRLISRLDDMLAGDGVKMICVLTLGPSVPEPDNTGDNYDGTRAFYRRAGFVPLRELGLRDWNDAAALMLARPVISPAS